MTSRDQILLLEFDSPSEPLCRSTILEENEERMSVVIEGRTELVEVGSEWSSYFHCEVMFSTQTVRVIGASLDGDNQRLELERVGAPRLAERRAGRRIQVDDVCVDIEDEIDCAVLDVGANGFSLVARNLHRPGAIVELTLRRGDKALSGQGAVQSAERHGDAFRHGVRVLDQDSALSKGLPELCRGLQAIHPQPRIGPAT